MKKNTFVTGISRGLGHALASALLARDYCVYGLSRNDCDLQGDLHYHHCDLADERAVDAALQSLLGDVSELQLVILNAGILGEIRDMSETGLDELRRIMDINVWSNKLIFDWLLKNAVQVEQVVLISSGAAVLGNRGWGGYAISKAALNMLTRLYAHEFTHGHLCAIAPGLIETGMMTYLCETADRQRFPALKRLQAARATPQMMTPGEAAEKVIQALPELRAFESGSFVDLRQIYEPEAYRRLLQDWKLPAGS